MSHVVIGDWTTEQTNQYMKFMILVSGPSSQGKTQSIVRTYLAFHFDGKHIVAGEAPHDLSDGGDVYVKVRHQGKVLGFCSQGDPYTDLPQKLQELTSGEESCDIILTACRTRGETINGAFEVAEEKSYEIIQTSTYYLHDDDPEIQRTLNETCAFGLKHLIETLLNN